MIGFWILDILLSDPTCCTEAASAQGSFPFVSSRGVSRGGLYFIAAPPAWPEVELEVHTILFFLSLFTTILTSHLHIVLSDLISSVVPPVSQPSIV